MNSIELNSLACSGKSNPLNSSSADTDETDETDETDLVLIRNTLVESFYRTQNNLQAYLIPGIVNQTQSN